MFVIVSWLTMLDYGFSYDALTVKIVVTLILNKDSLKPSFSGYPRFSFRGTRLLFNGTP